MGASDGRLDCLHTLLLMDDAVLPSRARESMIKKVTILKTFCRECGVLSRHQRPSVLLLAVQRRRRSRWGWGNYVSAPALHVCAWDRP